MLIKAAIQNVNRRWYGGDGTFGLKIITQNLSEETKEEEEK